jgi:uncharacterized membrane protein (DUF373 family)
MMGIGIVEASILAVVLVVWIGGAIVRKAGYSRWLSLLLLIPGLNIVLIWVFAFAKWPAERAERPG